MSEVLITGAGGTIGARLCETLLRRGVTVRALVRRPAGHLPAPVTVCDLSRASRQEMVDHVAGADAVVHLAGEDRHAFAGDASGAHASTIAAAEVVAAASARAATTRVVFLSTYHVYGARAVPGAILSESLRPEPRTAYAIARLAAEHTFARHRGTGELIVLRGANSFGPPADFDARRWTLAAHDLCRQAALEGEMTLASSGTQWLDFISAQDLCDAIALAAVPGPSAPPAGTYNLASGKPRTVRDLAVMIQDAFEQQTRLRPPLQAPRASSAPPEPHRIDVRQARAAGLEARRPLTAAVSEMVAYTLAHAEELPSP